ALRPLSYLVVFFATLRLAPRYALFPYTTLFRSISGNLATGGGGIFDATGTVTVTNSTISGNSAVNGGGIFNSTGTVTVANSKIRSEEHTSELQSLTKTVCRLLLEKKNKRCTPNT